MWIRNLFDSLKPRRFRKPVQPTQRGNSHSRLASCQLAIDTLEDRCVPAALLSVWDAAILEGDSGAQHAEVTVTLSEPHSNAVSVNYRTVDGTAKAGSDYNAVSGKLTFSKNEMTKTILVPIRDDRIMESDESFSIQLVGAKAGAKIANGTAQVTIADNEPRISISSYVSQLEGTTGTPMIFMVNLSNTYDLPVTVHWATADGSAHAGTDYVATADTLVFMPGETSKPISVLVNGDRIPELDRSFYVNLTSTPDSYALIGNSVAVGTIIDNSPRISISDAYFYAGYGETTITFTVSLSRAYDQDVTVDFTTSDVTAFAGVDYVASFGTLTFNSALGETSKTITIDVLDLSSTDEYFSVHLSGASDNASLSNDSAIGYYYEYYDYGYYDYGYYDYGYYYGYDYYGYYY